MRAPDFISPRLPGPYAVGFKVIEQYDRSRTWRLATDALGKPTQGERARPLQTQSRRLREADEIGRPRPAHASE